MSRFKRERQAGIGADAPPSVFMQPIAEKTPAIVRDTISCSKTGFPSTKQDIHLGVTPKSAPKPAPEVKFETENMQDYERENLQKVMSMSEKEVQESLATISTMFSATSLDFLRQRGLKELECQKLPPDSTLTSQPSPAPASQQETAPPTPNLPVVRPEDVIATSLEELQKRQLEAPPEVQARLAWTLDAPDSTTDEGERAKQRQFAADERFDLYGNKIISSQTLFSQITKLVYPTNSASKNTTSLQHLLSLCVDNSGLARDQSTYATLENQPQNELRHHESDMHRIGYTIRESCELIRSEVPSQRAIGLRIINGALQRRQFIVDLEAYSSSPQLYSSHTYRSIRDAFANVIAAGVSPRVLTFALLKLVATDFAPELPSVLTHRLLCHPQSRLLHNNLLELQCLQQYLFSDCENRVAEMLWRGSSALSGVPQLLVPHSRRSEMAYEYHMADCIDKRNAVLAEENKESNEAPMHFIEAFALSCRWHRVEAIFTETSVAPVLQYHVRDSIDIVVTQPDDATAMETVMQGVLGVEILAQAARCISSPDILFDTLKQLWAKGSKLLLATLSNTHPHVLRMSKAWLQFISEMSRRDMEYASWVFNQGFSTDLLVCLAQVQSPSLVAWSLRVWRVGLVYQLGMSDVEELLTILLQRWSVLSTDSVIATELYYFFTNVCDYCTVLFMHGGEDASSCIGIARSLLLLYQLSIARINREDVLCQAATMSFCTSFFRRYSSESTLGLRGSVLEYLSSVPDADQSEASVLLYDAMSSLIPPPIHPVPSLGTASSWEDGWKQLELINASTRLALAIEALEADNCLRVLSSFSINDSDAVCFGLFRWKIKMLIESATIVLIEGCEKTGLYDKAIICAIPLVYQEKKLVQLQQLAMKQLQNVLHMDEDSFKEISQSLFSVETDSATTQDNLKSLVPRYDSMVDSKRRTTEHFLYALLTKLPTQYTRPLLQHILRTEDGNNAGSKMFALCELLHADHLSHIALYDEVPFQDCVSVCGDLMLLLCRSVSEVTAKEFVQCVLFKQGASSNLSASIDMNSKRNLDSLLEYVSSLLATVTSQYTTQELHAISLVPVLIPGHLPWRCRQLVWKELGEWGLLHLMESPLWFQLRCEYMKCASSSSIMPTLAQSLSRLRCQDDMNLTIVSLGFAELATAFVSDIVTGSQGRMLRNIIQDTVTYSDSMVLELFVYISLLRSSVSDAIETRRRVENGSHSVDLSSALTICVKVHEEAQTVRDLCLHSNRKISFHEE